MVTLRNRFLPEGRPLHAPRNGAACAPRDSLRRAMGEETVPEGVAQLYNGAHNLLVSAEPFTGSLPREEAAPSIAEGATREIAVLSRVGKPVCFQITALGESEDILRPRLPRRRAQQAILDAMLAKPHPGCILPAVIIHLESFGTFVDIGYDVPSLIGIENIPVSRTPYPDQRFRVGQAIFAVVQGLDPKLGRVYLTHRGLLGAWVENATRFQAGMTVPNVAHGLKECGAFMELTPNLFGLAEQKSGLREGGRVSVYIKVILPERMGIRLLVIDILPPLNVPASLEYFPTQGQTEKWKYTPEGCVEMGAEAIFT